MKKVSPCIYEIEFKFEVQDELLMGIIHQELVTINNNTQVSGYRKGHAPLETLVKMYGPQVMRESLEERSLLELKKTLPENFFFFNESVLKLKHSSEEKGYEVNLIFLAVNEEDLNKPSLEDIVQKWASFKEKESLTLKKTFYLNFFKEAFDPVKEDQLTEDDDLLWHDGENLRIYPVKDFLFFQEKKEMPEELKKNFVDFLRLDSHKISKEYFVSKDNENLYEEALNSYEKATKNFLNQSFQEEIVLFYWEDFIQKNKDLFQLEGTVFASLLEKKSLQNLLMPCVHKILMKELQLELPKSNTSIEYITEPLRKKYAEQSIEKLASI